MPSDLEAFWTQNVKREEGFDRTEGMLEWLGAGWTASFLAKLPLAFSISDKGFPPSSRKSFDR